MTVNCDKRFRPLIEKIGAQACDEAAGVIYGVWKDLSLAYTNAAWHHFPSENDGRNVFNDWPLGRIILDACSSPLRPFYETSFRETIASGRVWEHTYACPSPSVSRWYAMRSLPLGSDGLLICHSLVARAPMAAKQVLENDDGMYRTLEGLVLQCSHCRRVRAVRSPQPDRWDFVPTWVKASLPFVSHGLCPLCFGYYYQASIEPDDLRMILDASMENGKKLSVSERT